jgi:hypothetical protein
LRVAKPGGFQALAHEARHAPRQRHTTTRGTRVPRVRGSQRLYAPHHGAADGVGGGEAQHVSAQAVAVQVEFESKL